MIGGTYFKNTSVTAINDISASDGAFIVSNGTKWVGESGATARTSLGLGNVENTTLSTWAGSSNITTLGTIGTGVWNGTSIGTGYTDAKCTATWPNTYTANQDLETTDSPTFVGLDLTGITDGNIPYMSAAGFADSPLSYDGSGMLTTGDYFDIGADCTGLYNSSLATLRYYGQSAMFYYDGGYSSYEFFNNSTTTAPNFIVLNRGRGDFSTPVIVNDDDILGSFTARGWDGVDEYSNSSAIYFEVDETPGENIMPGRIVFATSQAGSENLTTAMTIDSSQDVIIVGDVTAANLNLHNSSEEDTDGGRECRVVALGEQSGGEESILGYAEFSHDGASDDQKGRFQVLINDGDDDTTPSIVGLEIDSSGNIKAGTATISDNSGNLTSANGVASFSGAVSSITITNGIVTSIS